MAVLTIFLTLILFQVTVGLKLEEASDSYTDLAAISGGSVINSNKTDIDHASSITVAEAALAFPVIVTVTHVDALTERDVTFTVDNSLTVILVEITGPVDKKATKLLDPTGRTISISTIVVDSTGALVYKITSPSTGRWQLRFLNSRNYDVIVKGSSQVSFQHSFLQQKPGIPYALPIKGDPPAGKNLTVKIEVDAIDKASNITYVTLFALNGDVISYAPLTQIFRRDANTFKAILILPTKTLRVGITGIDKTGTPLTRVSRAAVTPESQIVVSFIITSGIPATGATDHLPFTVYNKGDTGNMSAVVTSDNMHLETDISPAEFQIQQNHTYNGSVTVTSLASTQSVSGNILLTITGPSGVSQFDSTLVTIQQSPQFASTLVTIQRPFTTISTTDNGGVDRAPAVISLTLSCLCVMFAV